MHLMYFLAIENYLMKNYNIKVDSSGKDVTRKCLIPHDLNAFVSEKSLIKELDQKFLDVWLPIREEAAKDEINHIDLDEKIKKTHE